MEIEEVKLEETLLCNHCETSVNDDDAFCQDCGYPLKGNEQDVAKFYAKRAMNKNKNIDAAEKIKSAKNTLFVIAGVVLLFAIVRYLSIGDIADLIINFIVCCMYILLGFWTEQKPLIALLLGLLLYVTLVVISAVLEPMTLVKGILWKIVIISYLGKGIYSASSIKTNA